MKAYLRRLLVLLENATHCAPRALFSEGEAYVRLDELLGLPAELFPAALRLSPRHAARVVRALRRALAAYRVYADVPGTLPPQRQYALLVARLGGAEVAYYGMAGTWVEFCDYAPRQCPYPDGYCACRDLVEEPAAAYRTRHCADYHNY